MTEKKGKVLCVDDEPNIVRALQWLLQKDFDVMTAGSGRDGLALVAQHDFDVVISDQRMPMMTGVEFLREVRKRSPRTMRILLTGYSDYQAILRSVNESEVFRFINKPWNISELPQVVEQAATIARSQPAIVAEPEISEETPIPATDNAVLLIDDDPAVRAEVAQALGDSVVLRYAPNLADATTILNEQAVAVILSETKVAGGDATRLIRLMKSRYPSTVAVMLTAENDADTVTALINQGQIYRFVPKPIRSGYLKLVVISALIKHKQLADNPDLARRYSVQASGTETAAAAATAVTPATPESEAANDRPAGSAAGSLIGRLSAGLKRLLG